jgi:hypothetical protein
MVLSMVVGPFQLLGAGARLAAAAIMSLLTVAGISASSVRLIARCP